MRGNFLDVPTDCPQRDERLGWTGDAQLFAPTAAFLYDVRSFLRSWLRDLAADQSDDERGIPPVFSPDIPVITPVTIPPATRRWPDGVTPLCSSPGCCYERYGDTEVLRTQYASMRAWIDAVDCLAGPGRIWGARASSSATGWTPSRRRLRPSRCWTPRSTPRQARVRG
ncbi:alpha-L-rhamnosidase-related protein [Streptomyces sp. NPDC055092]